MGHALREAHRVLRPGGFLIDLRPGPVHRRVGLGENQRWRLVGIMREPCEEDRLADRAVARAIRDGLFHPKGRRDVLLERVMDTVGDFHDWLHDFGQRRIVTSHGWLVRRLEAAQVTRPERIVSRGPLTLRLLRKRD